jgi:hypothetical protein
LCHWLAAGVSRLLRCIGIRAGTIRSAGHVTDSRDMIIVGSMLSFSSFWDCAKSSKVNNEKFKQCNPVNPARHLS